jgi:predicted AAA+ superfamily ATPase
VDRTPINRLLKPPDRSFFLFGARGTGKSTWLRQTFPTALMLDLLDTSLQLQLTVNPHALESLIGNRPPGAWIVLDEVQKIPTLLDEVHRLSELRRWRFALCGSSARKLKRGGANLLAGRALTLSMEPFSSAELKDRFSRDYSLDWGMLPIVQMDRSNAADILSAYVDTYLKEEIRTEGVIRSFPPFARFLSIAGQMNGQMLNMQNIAREAEIPRSSVDGYFSVLTDTLMAHFLPAYRPGLKVREAAHPKFFWVDAGIARAAAGLLRDPVDRAWKGASLETLIFHELRVYNTAGGKHRPLAYYRTPAGSEIDFIIETQKQRPGRQAHVVCVEAKLSPRWDRKWERAMRDLHDRDGIETDRIIGVYTGTRAYRFDKLDVWPLEEFLQNLHMGRVF